MPTSGEKYKGKVMLFAICCYGIYQKLSDFRSSNPDYLKSAIGRVQYRIEDDVYTVKAKVVPEHKVT